jgi:hypothetical protein
VNSEPHALDDVAAEPAGSDGRSAVAIVASLWEKAEALVQLEMKLALAEAEQKIDGLKRELIAKAIGGAVVFAGLLTLVAALVAMLALTMALWLAALLTSVTVIAAGLVLLRRHQTSVTHPADRALTQSTLTAAANTQGTSHGTV